MPGSLSHLPIVTCSMKAATSQPQTLSALSVNHAQRAHSIDTAKLAKQPRCKAASVLECRAAAGVSHQARPGRNRGEEEEDRIHTVSHGGQLHTQQFDLSLLRDW